MAVSEKSDFILCEIKSQLFHDSTHRNGYITAFTSICDAYHLFGIKVKVTKSAWSSSKCPNSEWLVPDRATRHFGTRTSRYQEVSEYFKTGPEVSVRVQAFALSDERSESSWVGLITAGQHRTLQDSTGRRHTPQDTIGNKKINCYLYRKKWSTSNSAQHKRINLFINNANGYSGWYVHGHDLYSRMRLLHVTEAIIAN